MAESMLAGQIIMLIFVGRSFKPSSSFSRHTAVPLIYSKPPTMPSASNNSTALPCSQLDHVSLCRDFCLHLSQEILRYSSHNSHKT